MSRPAPIRVLIADDYFAFRQGIKLLLNREPDIEVVAEATNGRQLVELAKKHQPAAVVTDLSMDGTSGIDAIRQIMAALPATRILILSAASNPRTIDEALAAGALGFIAKSCSLHELPDALRRVHRGKAVLKRMPAGAPGNSGM